MGVRINASDLDELMEEFDLESYLEELTDVEELDFNNSEKLSDFESYGDYTG